MECLAKILDRVLVVLAFFLAIMLVFQAVVYLLPTLFLFLAALWVHAWASKWQRRQKTSEDSPRPAKASYCALWVIFSSVSLVVLLVLAILSVPEMCHFPKVVTVPEPPGRYSPDADDNVGFSTIFFIITLATSPWVAWSFRRLCRGPTRNNLHFWLVWVVCVVTLAFSLFAKYMVHTHLSYARRFFGDVPIETISAINKCLSWQWIFLGYGVILLVVLTAVCRFYFGGDSGEAGD